MPRRRQVAPVMGVVSIGVVSCRLGRLVAAETGRTVVEAGTVGKRLCCIWRCQLVRFRLGT